ncbi:MAG: UDP-N-acetylglucosamine--N-acetylmuramyl-(pentapeptide) pyrophosphoryl-undecaprenol N-acetylglucosamine transferase [Ruminococcus sp.]|nr:UDP-N-acetylglucosamine--N-acetylmuramyl-(pentapeptide) pyrophosphoryl-undecaprenol N-acetylglucosamine transferase [Ruminococcus sp.]
MKYLLTGGGTAGHINPALAIISIIKDREPDAEFLYAGTPNGMESKLVPMEGIEFAPIKVSGFQRKITPKNIVRNIKAAAYLTTAGHTAKKILTNFSPDLVIGTGGYVSGPVVLEAERMGIPAVIHEQNAYPGVTTRILAKKAKAVMLTMEEAREYLDPAANTVKTGLPVRKGFDGKMPRSDAKRELGLPADKLCIFSWGGSLGAGAINDSGAALMKWEYENDFPVTHIHSYGKMGHDTFEQRIKDIGIDLEKTKSLIVKEYIHNMDVCTAAADLIICRSGASAISELEAMGRASILIPSPVVAGNHQYHNAMVLGKAGAAVVIQQKDLTDELIISKVKELTGDPKTLNELSRRAHGQCVQDVDDRIYKVLTEARGMT